MESRSGEQVAIAEGSRGQFDVIADGVLLFSKHDTGRFPEAGEVEGRFALVKTGQELPPIPPVEHKSFLTRLLSRFSN